MCATTARRETVGVTGLPCETARRVRPGLARERKDLFHTTCVQLHSASGYLGDTCFMSFLPTFALILSLSLPFLLYRSSVVFALIYRHLWSLDVGIWSLEVGIWSLEVGIWSLEVGIWSLEVAIWSQEV